MIFTKFHISNKNNQIHQIHEIHQFTIAIFVKIDIFVKLSRFHFFYILLIAFDIFINSLIKTSTGCSSKL